MEKDKEKISFVLLNNLGDDFSYDKEEEGIINHSIIKSNIEPTTEPVVKNKIWLFINTNTNTVTHYWNFNNWIKINVFNNIIVSSKEIEINECNDTIIFDSVLEQFLPKSIFCKKILISNYSLGKIKITGNINKKETSINILPKKSIVIHGDGDTWWLL